MRFRFPYWQWIVLPFACLVFGSACNAIAMGFNGGLMPVIGPIGCSKEYSSLIHQCMTQKSHLKFLSDWIVIPNLGVASIGDYFVWTYQNVSFTCWAVWAVLMIKDWNVARGEGHAR